MMHDEMIEARLRRLSAQNQATRRSKYTLAAALAAVLILPMTYLADTRLFPVVSKATAMIFYKPDEPGETHVRFIFQKHRNCKFVGSSFWVSGPMTTPVLLLKSGPTVHYPPGRTGTSIFVLGVPQSEYLDRGMFIVEHQCHLFWTHSRIIYG